jgi:hypothetical protein
MFGGLSAVRVRKVVRRGNRSGAKTPVLMDSRVARITENHAIFQTAKPVVFTRRRISRLVGDHVMSVVQQIRQSIAAMRTLAVLSKRSISFDRSAEVERSIHTLPTILVTVYQTAYSPTNSDLIPKNLVTPGSSRSMIRVSNAEVKGRATSVSCFIRSLEWEVIVFDGSRDLYRTRFHECSLCG